MSIYDYNLGPIMNRNIEQFVLKQVTPYDASTMATNKNNDTFSKSGNKKQMENKYQAMKTAELILRNNLDDTHFDQLKENKSLFIEAKYDLV